MDRIKKRVISHGEPQRMGEMPRKNGVFMKQKIEGVCDFERQREIYLHSYWAQSRFLPMVEMTKVVFEFFFCNRPCYSQPCLQINNWSRAEAQRDA